MSINLATELKQNKANKAKQSKTTQKRAGKSEKANESGGQKSISHSVTAGNKDGLLL